jgi:exodeoxyribonuclease-5
VDKLIYDWRYEHCLRCPEVRGGACHKRKGDRCCDWERTIRDLGDATPDLVAMDESSMLDARRYRDLLTFGASMLFAGDHGQLPPIQASAGVLRRPDITLQKIHRQLADSPILQLAYAVRETGRLPYKRFDKSVARLAASEPDWEWDYAADPDEPILCWLNDTRVTYNRRVRRAMGFGPEPEPGDRVICLQNNRSARIYNGMLGEISSIGPYSKDAYRARISLLDEDYVYDGLISTKQFGQPEKLENVPRGIDQWDWGYALTVHKMQGSEADRVILLEERSRFGKRPDSRWLYTGITRARSGLAILDVDA